MRSNLPALLDEWAGSLFRELDYRQEADNGARFKALYGALDRVFVPDMYRELTTQRVLVMEWVTGRRLRTSSEGPHRLAGRSCWLLAVSRMLGLSSKRIGQLYCYRATVWWPVCLEVS